MHYDTSLLGPVATNADSVSDALFLGNEREAHFSVSSLGTGNPVIEFELEGCDNYEAVRTDKLRGVYGTASETATWTKLTIPAGALHSHNGATVITSGEAVWTGATAVANFILILEHATLWLRLRVNNTSGGSASLLLTIRGFARGE